MNLKTGIISLLTLTSPMIQKTETVAQIASKPKTEIVSQKNLKTISKVQTARGKALVHQVPALFREPKPQFANQKLGNKSYDLYGNINGLYNSKNQLTRKISRDMEGNLYGYTDISYGKNGKKYKEVEYSNDWTPNHKIGKYEERKFYDYYGSRVAEVKSFNRDGKADFIEHYSTDVIDGEEVLMEKIPEEAYDPGCYR